MNKKLQDKLFKKYPKIFAQRTLDLTQTSMCWGLEVSDGWYDLLDVLCGDIQHYVDSSKASSSVPQVEAIQVKEKFASLRFYYQGGNDYIGGMVAMAESMSARICEECGRPGKTMGKGWFYTRCTRCFKRLEASRKPAVRNKQLQLKEI